MESSSFTPPQWSRTQFNIWLGQLVLLVPGAALIGLGALPCITRLAALTSRGLREASATRVRCLVLSAYTAAVVAALTAHALVLGGMPVTDDELADQFGGRVLAMGHVAVPFDGAVLAGMPRTFFYVRGNVMTSADWLGAQATWAIAEVTRSGPLVFALLAALPLPCLAYVCGRRHGRAWGVFAGLLLLASPMFVMLSMTTHTFVASRGLFALALVFFVRFESDGEKPRDAALVGLLLGLAFCCRPAEIATMSLPFVIAMLARLRTPAARRSFLALVAGAFLPLVAFGAHCYAVTGSPFLPARFAYGARGVMLTNQPGPLLPGFGQDDLWYNFGSNVAYNALLLGIWFLGPFGLALAALGVARDSFTKRLALGLVLSLGVALLHADQGIHAVGPLHYANAVVPLAILATEGTRLLTRLFDRAGAPKNIVLSPLLGAFVVGLPLFTIVESEAVHRQAMISARTYDFLDEETRKAGPERAIVVGPPYWVVARALATSDAGTWVHDWQRPRPDLSDGVMFLTDGAGLGEAVASEYPDRNVFRLVVGGTHLALVPVAGPMTRR